MRSKNILHTNHSLLYDWVFISLFVMSVFSANELQTRVQKLMRLAKTTKNLVDNHLKRTLFRHGAESLDNNSVKRIFAHKQTARQWEKIHLSQYVWNAKWYCIMMMKWSLLVHILSNFYSDVKQKWILHEYVSRTIAEDAFAECVLWSMEHGHGNNVSCGVFWIIGYQSPFSGLKECFTFSCKEGSVKTKRKTLFFCEILFDLSLYYKCGNEPIDAAFPKKLST